MVLTTSPRDARLPWVVEEKQQHFLTQVGVEDKERETEEVIRNFQTRSKDSNTLSPQHPKYIQYCKADGVQRFQSCIRPLWWLLQFLSMIPYRFCRKTRQYEISWYSWEAWRTILTAIYMTTLLAASISGLVIVISKGGSMTLDADEDAAAIKLAGFILVMQCLVNACVQLLCMLGTVRRLCHLMNSWCQLAASFALDITKGLKIVLIRQLSFLTLFWAVSITLTLLEYPDMFIDILDTLGQNMLLLPGAWTSLPAPLPQMIRLMTVVVCLHIFSLFKCCLFSFTINCHLLTNAIHSWNTQLSEAMDSIWERTSSAGGEHRLAHLVHTHGRLVSLVRETEASYSLVLQCYYGSAIFTLCTELYILAYRLGSKEQGTGAMVTMGMLILQTAVLFLEVSRAAAQVQEVSDDSKDILRRGLPFDAEDRDKFHRDELVTALTGSSICITGGKFFVINRPFIITVMSAVTTYFIVMMQFIQSSEMGKAASIDDWSPPSNSSLPNH